MKITTTKYSRIEFADYREIYRFDVNIKTKNGKSSVSFGNGEPEDMTLNRDLNCAYSIPDMVKLAYEAGKNGEELIIEELISDNDDEDEE